MTILRVGHNKTLIRLLSAWSLMKREIVPGQTHTPCASEVWGAHRRELRDLILGS